MNELIDNEGFENAHWVGIDWGREPTEAEAQVFKIAVITSGSGLSERFLERIAHVEAIMKARGKLVEVVRIHADARQRDPAPRVWWDEAWPLKRLEPPAIEDIEVRKIAAPARDTQAYKRFAQEASRKHASQAAQRLKRALGNARSTQHS